MNLREVVEKIGPEDQGAREEAHRRWSACAKPLGGLGFLETVVENVAALTGSAAVDFSHRALLVLCADNGVVAQGVTQSPSSVTAAVAGNCLLYTSPPPRISGTPLLWTSGHAGRGAL